MNYRILDLRTYEIFFLDVQNFEDIPKEYRNNVNISITYAK